MGEQPGSVGIDTAGSASRLCQLYGIDGADLERVRCYGEIVLPRIDEFISEFYTWMTELPEFHEFFSDASRLAAVQTQQRAYWHEFFTAEVDQAYIDRRRKVGEAHARIGLSLETYFAAMSRSLDLLTTSLYDGRLEAHEFSATVTSVSRRVHLDTSVVVETFTARTQSVIVEQSETLIQMSTPVTEIWDGILLLPIVGIVDSRRSNEMMNSMLTRIATTRARSIILDISGVAVVDTAVANHLIKITKATMYLVLVAPDQIGEEEVAAFATLELVLRSVVQAEHVQCAAVTSSDVGLERNDDVRIDGQGQ